MRKITFANYLLDPKSQSHIKTIAATTNKTWIKPPPILSRKPSNQKNTTIPPSQRKNDILTPPFSILFYSNYIIIDINIIHQISTNYNIEIMLRKNSIYIIKIC